MSEFLESLHITPLQNQAEAEVCAKMMAATEPWITLRRSEAAALKILQDATREVHVTRHGGEVVGFVVLVMQPSRSD